MISDTGDSSDEELMLGAMCTRRRPRPREAKEAKAGKEGKEGKEGASLAKEKVRDDERLRYSRRHGYVTVTLTHTVPDVLRLQCQ